MTRKSSFLLPLCAALLAGCGAPVVGTAVPDKEAAAVAPVTAAAFGDLRTIDACGMVTPEAFAAHGSARPLGRTSLDECTFAVTVGGRNMAVTLGLLDRQKDVPEGRRELRALPGGARVMQAETAADKCELRLVLVDGLDVSVLAKPQGTDVEFDEKQLCAVAEAGATGVHETARNGQIKHWEPAPNSLARLSPCGILPAAEITSRTGIAETDVTLLPAEHQCRWGPAGEKANVQLDFFAGKEVDDTTGVIGPPEDIAGRPTIIFASGASTVAVCNAYTDNIPYALGKDGEIERAVVRVLLPKDDGRDGCAIARELAALAWPKLPAK